jgi:hypothetical protein
VMDIAPLEQLTEPVWKAGAHLFDVKPAVFYKPVKRMIAPPPGFKVPNPPVGIPVHFMTTAKTVGKVEVTCTNASGKRVGLYLGKENAGLDSCVFDIKEAGESTITLKAGDVTQSKKVTVKELATEKMEEE